MNNRKRITQNAQRPIVQSLMTSFLVSKENDENLTNGFHPRGNDTTILPRMTNERRQLVDISYLPIYYNNVRGVTSKENLCTKIELSMYKVLVFTETWLSKRESSSVYFPDAFTVHRQDRIVLNPMRRYGGVAVIVHKQLKHQRLKVKESSAEVECVAIEVKLKPTSLIVYAAYMRIFDPAVAEKHVVNIKELCKTFGTHRIMVLGDFNMSSVRWVLDESTEYYLPTNIDTNMENFLTEMHELPFFQMSNIKNKFHNVLDLVFVNDLGDVELTVDKSKIIGAIQQDVSHVPYEIAFEYCARGTAMNIVEKEVICYKSGNYEQIINELSMVDYTNEIANRDVDSAFDFFYSTIYASVDTNVPKRMMTINLNRPEWWTKELQRLKNRRDKLFKRNRNSAEYVNVLNKFDELSSTLFDQYVDEVQDNISDDPAAFWKFAKLNSRASSYPSEMYLKDATKQTTKEIVDLFADFFEGNYVEDDQQWLFEDVYNAPDTPQEVDITREDIELAIHSLKWKGGVGPDQMSPFFFKKCAEVVALPLWLLWQKTFENGRIPPKVKLSRVVPVFKKGKKTNIENYRVVAISSAILKIFQRASKLQLTTIVEPHVSDSQHGFRPKRSVTTNLLCQSIATHDAFERGVQLDTFIGDFEKAFERVIHRLLVGKMPKFSIGPKTARWLYENISQIRYYVQIGETKSREYEATSGIVPGSIFGPVLFTMFINDVVEVVIHAMVLLFADDIKASMKIYDESDGLRLQSDIDRIHQWTVTNRLLFNVGKCATFTACRTTTSVETTYKLGDHELQRKEEVCDLGLLIDKRYNLIHHMEQTTVKARQMVGYIKKKSNGKFKVKTLKILYCAYVRSRLEFASVIWSPYQEVYKDDIESVQKQFMIDLLDDRSSATSYRLAPYVERCKTLKLQPLCVRRQIADAMCAYDIFSGRSDVEYLKSKFVRSRSVRQLRHNRLLEEKLFSVDYLMNQPVARLISCVNKYAEMFVNSRSRSDFKVKIEIVMLNLE